MDDRQYNRLLEIVKNGRKYHYRNFVFASLVLVLLLRDLDENLSLFLDLGFPVKYLVVFLHFIIILFTVLSIDIFQSIWNSGSTLIKDPVPLNWYILTNYPSYLFAISWLLGPIVISLASILFSELNLDKSSLFFISLFAVALPHYLKMQFYCIVNREDHEGNRLTISIYLLYWYRIFRVILLCVVLAYPLIKFFQGKDLMLSSQDIYPVLIALLALFGIRYIWEFFYKYIDKIGVKFGFAKEYKPN